jgi:hypothetical protein
MWFWETTVLSGDCAHAPACSFLPRNLSEYLPSFRRIPIGDGFFQNRAAGADSLDNEIAMKDFDNERWRTILAHNGLIGFDALWGLDAQWFEAPNQRRGGWSGVSRCELQLPTGGTVALFLKRQENHGTRSLLHPMSGVPTFLREFRRIMSYRQHEIPTLEPVYFGMRGKGRNQRAILATEELTGYVSLEDRVQAWGRNGVPPRADRRRILMAVAELLKKMHAHGIRHGCFFPKHVFIRVTPDGSVDARVIDLEKSRRRPLRVMCALRDLYSLSHYSPSVWSRTDRLWFFKQYLGIPHLNTYAKWLWHRVTAYSTRKQLQRSLAA